MQYCQIYIINLEFPFKVVESVFLKSQIINELFESPIIKIKKFLGSDLNIDGSGFLFHGKNNFQITVECTSKNLANFMKSYLFKILNINDCYIKENISIEINIYKNSSDNTTIIDFCFGHFNNNDYTKWVRDKLFDLEIKRYFQNMCIRIKNYILNSSNRQYIKMYHSLLIKTNYEIAYKIFKDFNNTAKVLGTDKVWEIEYKDNSIYSVNMNNGVSVDYHIYKEIENIYNKSKSIFYHKYKDNIPALNEWTKIDFFCIDKNKCLLIHETKLPEKISSFLYHTIDVFTVYILKKLRILMESKNK